MLKILVQANASFVKSGYGQACYFLIEIFKKLGHEVALFAYYGIEGSVVKWEGIDLYPRGHDPYGNDIVDAHMSRSGSDLLITMLDVHVLNRFGRRGFNWMPIVPVDGDPLTDGIKNALPGAMHIISMSRYGEEVLRMAGFPSTMIYLPIDTSFYQPIDRQKAREKFGWPDDAYMIGHIGMNRGFRKSHDLLLQAFQLVVAEMPDARLYLHTDVSQHDGLNLNPLIDNLGIRDFIITPPRYDAFMGNSIIWMLGLYNALDLYVQPSENEGQAMPVWEALSTGLPVVATAATALTETLEDTDTIAVQPMNRRWLPSNCFAYEVGIEDLANAMINARKKWGKKYVSLANRQKAIDNVSLNVLAVQWQDILNTMERRIRFSPQIRPWKENPTVVQVSTIRMNCGIAAYTAALMESLGESTNQNIVDILTLASPDQIPDCGILHIHYETSIFPPEQVIREILFAMRERGTKVIVTFHTVLPNVVNSLLVEKLIDRAIIHWPSPGMQIDPGTVSVLGGMGVPSYKPHVATKREEMREEYGFSSTVKIISTFGFAAVGRGHFEVLNELAPFMVYNKNLHLQLLLPENAFNPLGFQIAHRQIAAIVEQFGLKNRVHVVSEFLPSLEILNRLWMSDVGFLYMDGDTPSTSSAARFFVAARLPLVITQSTHFADLRGGVRRTSFDIAEFTREILATMNNQSLLAKLHEEHQQTYNSFVWPKFGEKHLGIYKMVLGR